MSFVYPGILQYGFSKLDLTNKLDQRIYFGIFIPFSIRNIVTSFQRNDQKWLKMIQNGKIIKIVDDFLTFWHSVEFSEEKKLSFVTSWHRKTIIPCWTWRFIVSFKFGFRICGLSLKWLKDPHSLLGSNWVNFQSVGIFNQKCFNLQRKHSTWIQLQIYL